MIQTMILYSMVMLFVISTIFTLVFLTSIDDEVIPERLRGFLIFPLYFGFTYIIASLSDNSIGMVMMAYVPAIIATIFSNVRTAVVVAFAKPLVTTVYLYSQYPASKLTHIWLSILISWTALAFLIIVFRRFGQSKWLYLCIAVGFGLLENFQAIFYPTDLAHMQAAMLVNMLSYLVILWLAIDLKERLNRYQENLSDELLRDPLTKVYNLKAFNEGKANAPESNPYVIAVLDVDKFKSLNDTLGHTAGNQIIQLTATTLLDTLQKYYPNEHDYRVFRFGGEEFVVVVLYEGDLDIGMVALQKQLNEANALLSERVYAEFNQTVSFSGGITSSRFHDEGYTSFRKADGLLYKMKKFSPGVIAVDTEQAGE